MGIYRLILKLRHRAYDSGRRPVAEADVPTVCVGNVTVGGTGKTPHTEMILRMLSGYRVAVLSRGYGRKTKGYLEVDPSGLAETYGDEPLQIARKFPSVRVVVDEDRVEGCGRLAESDLVVLDDAFQYRALKASLNIVLVDYLRPVFKDRLLPFGRLRDLPERIFEADVLIVSKCPSALSDEQRAAFASGLKLSDYDSATCCAVTPSGRSVKLLFSRMVYGEPYMVFPEGDSAFLAAKEAVVVSGIARNDVFLRQVGTLRKVVKAFAFRDHHVFTATDLRGFKYAALEFPRAGFATTEKDAQRLIGCASLDASVKGRLYAVPVEAEFLSPAEKDLFAGILEKLVKRGV